MLNPSQGPDHAKSIGRCVAAIFLAWSAMLTSVAVAQARAESESASS